MITKLTKVNGSIKIDIDGKIFEPLSFKSFRPTKENVSEFAKAGIKLFSILSTGRNCFYNIPYSHFGESWIGMDEYDFGAVDRQIEFFMENAPDCYYAVMFQLDTRQWWLDSHPNYPDSFSHFTQMEADPEWREAASRYMKALVDHVEEKYGNRIYGYYMLCGTTTEWMSYADHQRPHPIKEKYFKEYTNNSDAVIPSASELELPPNIGFYTDENVITYQRAHAELTANTILYFAKRLKEALNYRKVVGIYFGYLFEFAGYGLWNHSHLAYEKVFECNDIDIIASPSSYKYRDPSSTGAFMVADKSLQEHNKLYWFEFDQRTHLSQSFLEGVTIPPAGYHCKDDLEAVNLMRRDFMLCSSNGAGLWWFDMWDGWFRTETMMGEVNNIVNVSKRISELPNKSCAEVAVIVSGEVFYNVNKLSEINSSLLSDQRKGLLNMGMPFDTFSMGDLERIDISKYKLFVFLTAFETKPNHNAVIEKIKQYGGKTILWAYAPGYINGGIDEVSRLTDVVVKQSETPTVYDGEYGDAMASPYLYADDGDATVIDSFTDGKAAIVTKKCKTHTTVYSAIGNLSASILRKIAGDAGVHIYSKTVPVYVNESLIGVYNTEACEVYLKEDGIYEDVFSGKTYKSENLTLKLPKEKYTSKLFVLKQ